MSNEKTILRCMTCGNVDDGKSTLIGRLLFDLRCIGEKKLRELEENSKKYGTQDKEYEYALLVDGLEDEHKQGITVDVAYRYFESEKKRFILADSPGHEQFTKNMVTAASVSDLAIILLDVTKGIQPQTYIHSRILDLMGIKSAVLVINKLDAIGYNEEAYREITQKYCSFASSLHFQKISSIPVSALKGENLTTLSNNMPWYNGPTLLEHLDNFQLDPSRHDSHFRMPVQLIHRPSSSFRGFSGKVSSGSISVGEPVVLLPSKVKTKIKTLISREISIKKAGVGELVTIETENEVSVQRGDVFSSLTHLPATTDHFEIKLISLDEKGIIAGGSYLMRVHNKEVKVTVESISLVCESTTDDRLKYDAILFNQIGIAKLTSITEIVVDDKKDDLNQKESSSNKTTQLSSLSRCVLIDIVSQNTVAAGIIYNILPRINNLHWQSLEINKEKRAFLMRQSPRCIWFTGLSGAGKSTLANMLETRLHAEGRHTYILDGDNVRQGLNRDLGFSHKDRMENIRRVAEVAKLMVDAGLIVMVSFISPFKSEREYARSLFKPDEFIEIYTDCTLDECERRDTKGLYSKAKKGEIKEFTGISSPYEPPNTPEIHLHTYNETPEESLNIILKHLFEKDEFSTSII